MARKPKYRRHTTRNLGFVEFNGKRHYMPGAYKSPESLDAYRKFLRTNLPSVPLPAPSSAVLVGDIVLRFEKWAEENYPPGSRSEYGNCHAAFGQLLGAELVLPASDFGPLCLKTMMGRMAKAKATRTYINAVAARIKRAFKWAVSEELIQPNIYYALATVQGIRKGRTTAIEPKPKAVVSLDEVAPVLSELSPTVRSMVLLQWFTGARSQSICGARVSQFNRDVQPWEWRPFHKTRNTHDVTLYVGPQAQQFIATFFDGLEPGDFLFEPRHLNGKRAKGFRSFYDSVSYLRAVRRAIDRVNTKRAEMEIPAIAIWTPHQLRHSRGTLVRAKHGLEAAQATLGHSTLQATQLYAQKQMALARLVAKQMG